MSFLLYGASGYTGQLIAEQAIAQGLKPTLAGRSQAKIQPIAEALQLPYKVFDLQHTAALEAALREVPVVLHAAGPFMFTAKPMMEACLRTGTHYLDITGEIAVFETAARLDGQARQAGIMLLPGAGFDVVPTDCLALHLKNQMPNAQFLQLAFAGLGGVSQGTATTMAENLGEGGAVRKDGKIVRVPLGHKTMTIPFKARPLFAMTIPWGDVSTAYYSTGIPNIETYMAISPAAYRWVRLQHYFNWLLRTRWVRAYVKSRIRRRPAGPSPERRAKSRSFVWGQVSNATGQVLEAQLVVPEGYTLTALTSLLIVQKVLQGQVPAGFQTPAKAYGADLIMEVAGVERY